MAAQLPGPTGATAVPTIPKIIHQIWLGSKPRPIGLMESCRRMNPGWEYRLWTDTNLPQDFINQHHIDAMGRLQPHFPEAGQADIIRYELLHRQGGFFVDADSEFIRPLDDELTCNDAFCCYENETARSGLLANGYLASTRQNALMALLIKELQRKESVVDEPPWKATGPLFLTHTVKKYAYKALTVYPSHYFIPQHFTSDTPYSGPGKVYCLQHWHSTLEEQRRRIAVAERLTQEGKAHLGAGNLGCAAAFFRQAIESVDTSSQAHRNLGLVCWQQGEAVTALKHLTIAMWLDPDDEDTIVNIGRISCATGRPEMARKAFERYLDRHPANRGIAALLAAVPEP